MQPTDHTDNILNHQEKIAMLQARHRAQLQVVQQVQEQLVTTHAELAQIEHELASRVHVQYPLSVQGQAVPPANISDADVPAETRRHSDMGQAVTLILNPAARVFLTGIHTPDEVLAALKRVGFVPTLAMTTPEVDAYQLAAEAAAAGAMLVVAAGGDGTIEEVAAALVDRGVTLGILPLGTMNNVARSLGIPLDLDSAAFVLAMGALRYIDMVYIVSPDENVSEYFLETAGIGLSAVAMPFGEAYEKGRWSELFQKLGEFLSGASAQVTVRCDDEIVLQAQTYTITVANMPLVGSNILVAPDAKVDDGLLDLTIYADMELVDLTTYFYAIPGGQRTQEPRLLTQRARHIYISTEEPLAVNADLDVLEKQHVWEITVKPCALTVVVGNGIGLTCHGRADAATNRWPAANDRPIVGR